MGGIDGERIWNHNYKGDCRFVRRRKGVVWSSGKDKGERSWKIFQGNKIAQLGEGAFMQGFPYWWNFWVCVLV